MTLISVFGSRGGIGVSCLSWSIAKEMSAFAILDYSKSQSLSWVINGNKNNFDWPIRLSNHPPNTDLLELLEKATSIEGIKVFSGGIPVKTDLMNSEKTIVIDGEITCNNQVLLTSNLLQDLENKKVISGLSVIRQMQDGVPIQLLEGEFNYSYRSQRNVRKSINNGLGVIKNSNIQKVARLICADILRDTSSSN